MRYILHVRQRKVSFSISELSLDFGQFDLKIETNFKKGL